MQIKTTMYFNFELHTYVCKLKPFCLIILQTSNNFFQLQRKWFEFFFLMFIFLESAMQQHESIPQNVLFSFPPQGSDLIVSCPFCVHVLLLFFHLA